MSQMYPVHALLSYLIKINFIVIVPSTPRSHKWSLSSCFDTKTPNNISHPMHSACPAHFILVLFVHRNNIWTEVQILKLLTMQFSPVFCNFHPVRPKHLSQHPVIDQPQSVLFVRDTFHAHVQNNRKNCSGECRHL